MANLEQLRSSLHSNLEEVRPSFIHLFIRLKKTKCESENVKKVKKLSRVTWPHYSASEFSFKTRVNSECRQHCIQHCHSLFTISKL